MIEEYLYTFVINIYKTVIGEVGEGKDITINRDVADMINH
jgi:hypothetical protein